jgi:hypothetical protein
VDRVRLARFLKPRRKLTITPLIGSIGLKRLEHMFGWVIARRQPVATIGDL